MEGVDEELPNLSIEYPQFEPQELTEVAKSDEQDWPHIPVMGYVKIRAIYKGRWTDLIVMGYEPEDEDV